VILPLVGFAFGATGPEVQLKKIVGFDRDEFRAAVVAGRWATRAVAIHPLDAGASTPCVRAGGYSLFSASRQSPRIELLLLPGERGCPWRKLHRALPVREDRIEDNLMDGHVQAISILFHAYHQGPQQRTLF